MLIRAAVVGAPSLRSRVHRALAGPDVLVSEVEDEDAISRIQTDVCDLAFLPSAALGGNPRETISLLRGRAQRCEVVVLQAREEPEERAALLGVGCFGVLSESLSDEGLRRGFSGFVRRRREWLVRELAPEPPVHEAEPISTAMRALIDRAARVARADSPLLLLGETGSGKEWLARMIHSRSHRARGPFVAVNCAAFPEALFESELFGHERGAFTGAERGRRGRFEMAHRGTLFLDEIGDVPLHQQPKLLRALETRSIQRLGSEDTVEVDARVVAAAPSVARAGCDGCGSLAAKE
jgi:DNA-binding NtrC family response regulator